MLFRVYIKKFFHCRPET